MTELPSLLVAGLRAHAQTAAFAARVAEAEALLREFLSQSRKPYVAYSGGKDSQVVLDLAVRLKPDIMVVWEDEEWIYPTTLAALEATERHYGIAIHRLRYEGVIKTFFAEFDSYNPPPVLRPYPVYRDIQHFFEAHRLDGYVLGIRTEESNLRRKSIGRRGAIGVNRSWNVRYVYPIYNWRLRDVWAYIVSRELPVNEAYALMLNEGVPLKSARVSSLCVAEVYRLGVLSVIKKLWPETWNEFVRCNPEVQRRYG